MLNGIYNSTMGALVQATRHSVIANNLANTETTGYKPDAAVFRELPVETVIRGEAGSTIDPILQKTGGGVWLDRVHTIYEAGTIRESGSPFTAAIVDDPDSRGRGFFMVEGADGNTYYTRDGFFRRNDAGELTMSDGVTRVLDASGQPITVGAAEPYIRNDGVIVDRMTNEVFGGLGLARFDDPGRLTKIGDNLFAPAPDQTPQTGGVEVRGGMVEESASNPITEMVNMIEASRAYESNMRFVTMQDGMLGRAVTQIGSVRQ